MDNYDIDRETQGQFKLFYWHPNVVDEIPCAGLFWCPQTNTTCVVYGGIFQEYVRRGHCQGPLGFPTTDEMTFEGEKFMLLADGLDRISNFQHGALLWDAQTRKVSDYQAMDIKVMMLTKYWLKNKSNRHP